MTLLHTIEDIIIAEYRKRSRRESLLPQVPFDDADSLGFLRRGLEDSDFRIDLKEKLAELQARGKKESMAAVVFRMKWFLGCKLTEVSEVLGLDYKTVVTRYAVALDLATTASTGLHQCRTVIGSTSYCARRRRQRA